MLNEVLLILIAFLGAGVGYLLSIVAKEEVSAGKKNLILFRNILFAVLFALFVYETTLSTMLTLVVVVIAIVLGDKQSNTAGLLLGLNPTFLMSSVVFLYGFPTGSLLGKRWFRESWQFLVWAGIGFIARIILV